MTARNIPLTIDDKKALADGGSGRAAGLVEAGEEQLLFMDSHGCNVYLVPCRGEASGVLYGFTYRMSSEESFYDDDPMEAIPIHAVEVTKIEYIPASGEEWNDLV